MQSNRERPPLLVRADAGASIGTGHLMRCLALAEAWQARGGTAVFLSRCESRNLQERVEAAGVDFIPLKPSDSAASDLQTTLSVVEQLKSSFVVLDGYHFDLQQQKGLREAGHRLMIIDDTAHLARYDADILLNQNLGATQLSYRCDPQTMFLLGPEYALLRREFIVQRGRLRTIPAMARKILVTLGGGDRENVTLQVINALRRLSLAALEVRIVVGPTNPHLGALRDAVGSLSMPAQLLTNVSDMASLMAWADLAISAGGTTCWELAYSGLPAVTIVLAENQRRIAEQLDAAGVVVNAGWHQDVSVEHLVSTLGKVLYSSLRRQRMSQLGRGLVDGRGAERVVSALLNRSCVKAA